MLLSGQKSKDIIKSNESNWKSSALIRGVLKKWLLVHFYFFSSQHWCTPYASKGSKNVFWLHLCGRYTYVNCSDDQSLKPGRISSWKMLGIKHGFFWGISRTSGIFWYFSEFRDLFEISVIFSQRWYYLYVFFTMVDNNVILKIFTKWKAALKSLASKFIDVEKENKRRINIAVQYVSFQK